ncbi:hypothetical protein ACN47E_007820 [Coniothyrium glycines]
MFGHPGISALEYAGSLEATRKRNTSDTSESLKRKSASTQHENSSLITAGTELTGPELSPPVHFIDEFGCQQRRRGTFVNHTPRDFEMRPSKAVEVYQPSRATSRASIENYSRPRMSYQATAPDVDDVPTNEDSAQSVQQNEKRMTVNHGAPAELDSTEVTPFTPKVHKPSADPHRRSISVPVTKIITYQPYSAVTTVNQTKGRSMRSSSTPVHRPQEKKRQRRQTPFPLTIPSLTDPTRHTPLEPLVTGHQRQASNDTMVDFLPKLHTDTLEEMGTFGVIQKYFDSQTGGPVSAPKTLCQRCTPKLPDTPPSTSPEPQDGGSYAAPTAVHPVDEFSLLDEPPALPERSPKRLTNPSFPVHTKTPLSLNTEFRFAAQSQYSPYEKPEDDLCIQKARQTNRLDVGQADRAGSSHRGKLAPPILSHSALTASSLLHLNDLNFYLRNTGPSPEPQPIKRQRHRKGIKIFKVKQRKSLAARVGSVEGSPQRARKQALTLECTREETTSAGAKHMKIVIPAESRANSQVLSGPATQSGAGRRSRYISISFTEEMLNPLASPQVEKMLSGHETPPRSLTEPIAKSPRSPKRAPKSPRRVPTMEHPLLTRVESTRARKLRDLERIRRKPLPNDENFEHVVNTESGDLPTPAQTPEPVIPSCTDDVAHLDEDIESNGSQAEAMARIRERAILLQRQNTELTEVLAKILGLELDDGDLRAEDVLKAFRQGRHSKVSGGDLESNTLC